MIEPPTFSVIIPAHNEEAVIARCLQTILGSAPQDHAMQIVVAANGCSDRTVEITHQNAPQAIVLDLAEGSKTAAINAANQTASSFPRVYVDADVEVNYNSLAALARMLVEPGVMTAAPAIRINVSQCNMWMRAYYRAWMKQPYARAGKGGAGCYGLSEAALKQVGKFPRIIGDDIWIHTRFPDAQKRFIESDASGAEVFSVVYPPNTAWQQIKVEARRQNGNAEVRKMYPSPYFANANHGGGFKAALTSGAGVIDLTIFFAIKFAARALARWKRARGKGAAWTRDLSTRQA